MFFEPSWSLQISVYLFNRTVKILKSLFIIKNQDLLVLISSTNDINLISIDDCTITRSNWLQIIQSTPSWTIIASNRSDFGTIPTSNEKCSLACCDCRIFKDTEKTWKIYNDIRYITYFSKKIANLLIMIWIVSNFGPWVTWNIIDFSLISSWTTSTNSQRRFIGICKGGVVMRVLWIGLIVKYKSIITL